VGSPVFIEETRALVEVEGKKETINKQFIMSFSFSFDESGHFHEVKTIY